MRAGRLSFLVPSLLLVSVGAVAQPAVTRPAPPLRPTPVKPADEITIYRDRNFSGPAVSIRQDEANLGLAWTVGSARVRGGTWELCERPRYQGACHTVWRDSSNLGQRRVQSVRPARSGTWRDLGGADVNRVVWTRSTIRVRGTPGLWAVRLCAERNRVRLQGARAYFTNGRFQNLQVPAQLASGACTGPLAFPTSRNISSVEVTAATVAVVTRARIRLEGR
ncbi:MAG: beta/gamma crystallin family protein [Novosphingobium sp.]|jgi:hypothetical protein|nr:beta/gamma crystallin family protein [Novosphingobium sp.]